MLLRDVYSSWQTANGSSGVSPFLCRLRSEISLTDILQVVDHYEKPRNVGSFDKKDLDVGTGLVGAPACGDVMKLQIRVRISLQSWLSPTHLSFMARCIQPASMFRVH